MTGRVDSRPEMHPEHHYFQRWRQHTSPTVLRVGQAVVKTRQSRAPPSTSNPQLYSEQMELETAGNTTTSPITTSS